MHRASTAPLLIPHLPRAAARTQPDRTCPAEGAQGRGDPGDSGFVSLLIH